MNVPTRAVPSQPPSPCVAVLKEGGRVGKGGGDSRGGDGGGWREREESDKIKNSWPLTILHVAVSARLRV